MFYHQICSSSENASITSSSPPSSAAMTLTAALTIGDIHNSHTYSHTYTHIYSHIYSHTHKHTNTQTHKHTNTRTHKHTNTQNRKIANTHQAYVVICARKETLTMLHASPHVLCPRDVQEESVNREGERVTR